MLMCKEHNLFAGDLSNADLQGASFSSCLFQGTNLSNANLRRADFSGVVRYGVQPKTGIGLLERSILPNSRTVFAGANLSGADLKGCILRGIDLTRTTGLTRQQLETAVLDSETKLP